VVVVSLSNPSGLPSQGGLYVCMHCDLAVYLLDGAALPQAHKTGSPAAHPPWLIESGQPQHCQVEAAAGAGAGPAVH
jgi:hypothetical protein